jgi:hypothetical protein
MWRKLARLRLSRRILLLSSAVALAWLLLTPVTVLQTGAFGMTAATLAAALCLTGAIAALIFADRFRRPEQAILVLGISIIFRTAIPLAIGAVVFLQSPLLAEAGWMYYLLVFYLVTLACETVLLVAGLQGADSATAGSTATGPTITPPTSKPVLE